MKRTEPPTFNWDLPDVEVPDDPGCPVLTAEQWVVWFRTLPTYSQIKAAESIIELQAESGRWFSMDIESRMGRAEDTVESLRTALRDIKTSLRSILDDTKTMKPQKRRAAMLAERITAIGVAIKGMGL